MMQTEVKAVCTHCTQVAVATIKVASQGVARVPSIFFFPIVPFLITVGFTAYWCIVAAYLYSAGDINPHYRNSAADQPANSISFEVWSPPLEPRMHLRGLRPLSVLSCSVRPSDLASPNLGVHMATPPLNQCTN